MSRQGNATRSPWIANRSESSSAPFLSFVPLKAVLLNRNYSQLAVRHAKRYLFPASSPSRKLSIYPGTAIASLERSRIIYDRIEPLPVDPSISRASKKTMELVYTAMVSRDIRAAFKKIPMYGYLLRIEFCIYN